MRYLGLFSFSLLTASFARASPAPNSNQQAFSHDILGLNLPAPFENGNAKGDGDKKGDRAPLSVDQQAFPHDILGLNLPAPFEDGNAKHNTNHNITVQLFAELEELSRVVDISYCVSTTGIQKPFVCASRCAEFPGWELVGTFDGSGVDGGVGYIVLDHEGRGGSGGRVMVVFRGTYSFADTIADLSTRPQEYVPYPSDPGHEAETGKPKGRKWWRFIPGFGRGAGLRAEEEKPQHKCNNCTVHSGFWSSWQNTRPFVLGHLEYVRTKYPGYQLHLVGHSLGGAVAALAALEFEAIGWEPIVTTFGEPRVGNVGLRDYIDGAFGLMGEVNDATKGRAGRYRRITHVDDPVPLLPLQEWGYRAHAGEIFISKLPLQPTVSDIRLCEGDEDPNCISAAEVDESWFHSVNSEAFQIETEGGLQKRWPPARYRIWQLFFAHRDYFWRLGLCVPGGDPMDWGRDKYRFDDGKEEL